MTKFILVLLLFLTGCVTYTPKPAPIPCDARVRGECREMTAGERSGAVVRGHGEEIKDGKP